LAITLTHAGRLEEAEVYANRAIRLNINSPEAHRTLYAIAIKKEKYQEALDHLKKLSKLVPKDGEIHINMAALYLLFNQPAKARKAYEKGIALGGKPREKLEALLF